MLSERRIFPDRLGLKIKNIQIKKVHESANVVLRLMQDQQGF